jgi:hypothetical protein
VFGKEAMLSFVLSLVKRESERERWRDRIVQSYETSNYVSEREKERGRKREKNAISL